MTHFNRSVEERIGADGAFCPSILRKPAVDPAWLKIVPRGVVYESWILARSTRAQLTTADNRAG